MKKYLRRDIEDDRFDPFTETESKYTGLQEVTRTPTPAPDSTYYIYTQEIPASTSSVSISGKTEVFTTPADGSEFRVDYDNKTGLIEFGGGSGVCTINYAGLGSPLDARRINRYIDRDPGHYANPAGSTYPPIAFNPTGAFRYDNLMDHFTYRDNHYIVRPDKWDVACRGYPLVLTISDPLP
jgi:hypothetical protein